jgi:hypothetical protein
MRNPLRNLLKPLFVVVSLAIGLPVFALTAREDIQLIPQMPAQGTVEVTFHPGKTVTKGQTVQVQFGVPLPPGVLTNNQNLALQLNGVEVPIAVKDTVYWHATDVRAKSIRSVLVTTDITFQDVAPKKGTIVYGAARKANYSKTAPDNPASAWVSIGQEVFPLEFSTAANIREPKVYATFPPSWLDKSLLRTRTVPLGENTSMSWFDESLIEFGKTAVNDVPDLVKPENRQQYETAADNWLFDRAQTLFSAYIRTGDVKWLRHAHRNAQFYKNNIDANGHFKLKLSDLKYAYGQSMLIDYILTGDKEVETPIKNVAKYTATWKETYTFGMNFWTERHQTYALLGALTAWELTGDAAYLTRAKTIVHASLNQIRSPVNGWSANSCILHTLRSHEGDSSDDPVCSGWMSAFLGEAVWKYYIHTKDSKALEVLSAFGDFLEQYITFTSQSAHLTGLKLPYYLASSARKINENGDWGALEHACDVGGFTARTALAKKLLGQKFSSTRQLAVDYLTSCKYSLNNWHRPDSATKYGTADWRLSPSRKYNWWFGTTIDYDWLLRAIDYGDSKPLPPSNLTAVALKSGGGAVVTPPPPTTPTTPPDTTPPPTTPTTPPDTTPPPTTPTTPPPTTTPSTPADSISKAAFTNVTLQAIDKAPYVDYMFDVDFMHGNDDGCWDLFVGNHGSDTNPSAMYLQDIVNGKCAGTFKYYPNPNKDNYSQPTSKFRITSNYAFGDLNGDGTWDILGWDVDGAASGRYLNTTPKGQKLPIYAPKTEGCWGSRNSCVPLDVNGDGNVDLVGMEDKDKNNAFQVPSDKENYREIRDAVTGAVLFPAQKSTSGEGYGTASQYVITDLDNDSWPDIIDISQGGYWRNQAGQLVWNANGIPYGLEHKYSLAIDYDSDGDMDIFALVASYATTTDAIPALFRNDGGGKFTDVTSSTKLVGLIKSTKYWSAYSNKVVADLNNDGYPDIVLAGETIANSVTILWNNGDGSFGIDRTINFGGATNGKPRVDVADYDRDGKMDILKTHSKQGDLHDSVALFRNTLNSDNHWMNVKVRGPGKNTDGLHTRLTWKVPGTNRVITTYEVGYSGWFNQLQPHAGLGKNTVVDLEVRFPHGGKTYKFTNLPVDQDVVVYSDGRIEQNWQPGPGALAKK